MSRVREVRNRSQHKPRSMGSAQQIDDALRAGGTVREVAKTYGRVESYVQWRRGLVRQETAVGIRDRSCPQFAHDDEFVTVLMRRGGLPRFAEAADGRMLPVLIGPDGKPWREIVDRAA